MKTLVVTLLAGAALVAAATAAPPVTLTLASSAPTVAYGKTVTMTGTLSTHKANQQVSLVGRDCMNAVKKVANVKTDANGAFRATVTPAVGTSYQASQKQVTSNSVAITLKPLVQIKRVKRGSFTAMVTAGLDLKGKTLLFQRYATVSKRWRQVKKVTLTTSAPGTKPTVVSSAAFTAKVAKRARIRLALTKTQASPCYLPANSNTVRN